MPAETSGAGAGQGLAWSWELDFDALLASLAEAGLGVPDGADGADDPGGAGGHGGLDEAAGRDGEPVPGGVLAGRVAERVAPGPGLAALLSQAPAGELGDFDLAASAGSWRRLASWAQSRELAAVAQIVSRTAARDKDTGVADDGRPARVPASAAAEVALELTMSRYSAAAWADLAVELGWRLAATGAALAGGTTDLPRARLIVEATAVLDDAAARAVEAQVLPGAGKQTTGMLRAALRRAVILADPGGAERRREDTERQAKVVLYPDQESTATLAGLRLPGIHAAAAMARITAMARAWKAAGAAGPADLLRAKIYLGLLLGTQPPIPPADGAPPDDYPGGSDDGGPGDPYDPAGPGHSGPGDPGPGGPGPGGPGPGGQGGGPGRGPGSGPGSPGGPRDDGRDGDGRGGPGNDGHASRSRGPRPAASPRRSPAGSGVPGRGTPGGGDPGGGAPGDGASEDGGVPDGGVPPPGDADAPRGEEDYPCQDSAPAGRDGHDNDDDDGWRCGGPAPPWPGLPAVIPPAFPRPAGGRPAPGLLDLTLPWEVLAGTSASPGHLGRIGPVTSTQARLLAGCAARDPAAEWRIIITGPAGHAITVTRIPRSRGRPAPPVTSGPGPGPGPGPRAGPAPGDGTGLVSRVTLTIPEDLLAPDAPPAPETAPADPADQDSAGPPRGILARALKAATTAAARARATAAADADAGGCAHHGASPGYRPPPRLREHVIARDVTCRSPVCRQPAWQADLDHTLAYDDGGITCDCNLGGTCRTDHVLKHSPGWKLEQTTPGTFTWTTPSGRTYTTTPDTHPL